MAASALPGSDGELVQMALRGQSQAFGELYNRYFPSVYDFLRRMTRNDEEAADLAQETFLKAMENLRGLQNVSRFKSWLFSIAHHGAANRLERRNREVVPSRADESGEDDGASDPLLQQVDPDRLTNPEQAAEAQELAGLVWEAAAGLDPRTYAVLDLHVRQGLESAEIAEVMGVSKSNAYTMLNRMKKSVEEAIGTFLLARRGSKDCEELQAILAPVSIPPVTQELRRTIDRHVRRCEVCSRRRRALLTPVEVFGALAAVPAPVGLQGRIWGELETRWAELQVEGVDAASDGGRTAEHGGRRGPSDEAGGQFSGTGPPERQEAAEAVTPASAGGSGGLPPARTGGSDGLLGWSGWFQWAHQRWVRRPLAMAVVAVAILVVVPLSVVLSLQLASSDSTPSGSPFSGTLDDGTTTATPASSATAVPTTIAESTAAASSLATPAATSVMPVVAPSAPPANVAPGPGAPQSLDTDGDEIADSADQCPYVAETYNGFEDEDGCPDEVPPGEGIPEEVRDRDGDGIPDSADGCPDDSETSNGFEDEDGCPDEVPPGEGIPGEAGDRDGDEIPDSADHCPDDPETYNGFEDEDGCPDGVSEHDSDGDGIPDGSDECPVLPGVPEHGGCPPPSPEDSDGDGYRNDVDQCPVKPETFNGWQDGDGCPDEVPDSDGDGYNDLVDNCPVKPETFNGWQDGDGCPDVVPDSDGDGYNDLVDNCPVKPETFNGWQDGDGCPDAVPDSDGDGYNDLVDNCPLKPETFNGYQDEDGCPDLA